MDVVEVIDFEDLDDKNCNVKKSLKDQDPSFPDSLIYPDQGVVEIGVEDTEKGLALRIQGNGSCLITVNDYCKFEGKKISGFSPVKAGYKYQQLSLRQNISREIDTHKIDIHNMSLGKKEELADRHFYSGEGGFGYSGSWWIYCNKSDESPIYFNINFDIYHDNYWYGRRYLLCTWQWDEDQSHKDRVTIHENGWQTIRGDIGIAPMGVPRYVHSHEEDEPTFLPGFTGITAVLLVSFIAVCCQRRRLKDRSYGT